jgi:hypothetical protein
MPILPIAISALIASFTTLLSATDKDVHRSTLTIYVGKAGVFSAAGHEHRINAPISAGVVNDSDQPRVEFRVEASKMAVKPDPAVDSKTQSEIQRNMQEKTLESATIRQPDFGIKPISVAGGAVKVKDELAIDFHIVTGGQHDASQQQ